MKWKDLSLKERKQIYDSVKVNNPGATYFDIKEQFDSIPAYQNGKGKTINKADLPPEYRTGTPEYFERQRKISGAVNTVQPEVDITPAGYIKDVVNFIEDLGKGDYAGAAMDAVLNLIPWGVGKSIKRLKSKVGRIVEGTEIDGATEEDYDSEFSEVLRQEISRTIEQAIFPDERTRELVENVDKTYGTNYKRAYSNIAYKDMTKKRIINMENLYPVYPIPSYKDGGIHIKKKNRGRFNALKKRTGKSTEELTHSKNPLTRKRAIFAQNAAKWNHKGRKKK